MWQLHEIIWLLIIIMSILISLNDEVLTKKNVSDIKKSNHKNTKKTNHKETKKSNQNKEQIHPNKQSKKSHSKHNLNKGHSSNHKSKTSFRPVISINKVLQLEKCPLTRIIGGGVLTEGQMPYTAIYYICPKPPTSPVTTKGCEQWCGGSIISKLHIITAAHCLTEGKDNTHVPANKIVVRVGFHDLRKPEDNETTIEAIATIIHKDFALSPVVNDIALIKLKNEITFTERVQPICINGLHYTYYNYTCSAIAGWGLTVQGGVNSKDLKGARVTIYSYPQCKVSESQSLLQFCANSSSNAKGLPCNGDSGSGLLYLQGDNPHNILLGIISTGGNIVNNVHICGNPMKFVNVSSYAHWINEHVAE